mmetsp:Transcript_23052/g.74284  ORF Transcript_23052/g.74284 Transcript_23052/m.74284 type:complete len:222 (+) Transcript_23052:875-1540(+)
MRNDWKKRGRGEGGRLFPRGAGALLDAAARRRLALSTARRAAAWGGSGLARPGGLPRRHRVLGGHLERLLSVCGHLALVSSARGALLPLPARALDLRRHLQPLLQHRLVLPLREQLRFDARLEVAARRVLVLAVLIGEGDAVGAEEFGTQAEGHIVRFRHAAAAKQLSFKLEHRAVWLKAHAACPGKADAPQSASEEASRLSSRGTEQRVDEPPARGLARR